MNNKNTYTFVCTVRENESVKAIIEPMIELLAMLLNTTKSKVMYMGTLDCVATFTATSEDMPMDYWQLTIEEEARAKYAKYISSLKTYRNYKERGYALFKYNKPDEYVFGKDASIVITEDDYRDDSPW